MSEAIARLFIQSSRKVTSACYNNTDQYLFRRVADLSREVASLGQYVDVDEVRQAPEGRYYTGEVSDCTAFVIRRGPNVLLSHVQGYGDSGKLASAILSFRHRTDHLGPHSEFFLWTMPTTLDLLNYDNSSIKVIINALLAAYGEIGIQVTPTLTTIVTGHRGVNWNGYGVAFATPPGVGGMYERKEDYDRNDPYQGLTLAKQFKEM